MEKSYEYLLDRWHEGVEMQRTVDYGDPKSVRRFNRGSDIYIIILNRNLAYKREHIFAVFHRYFRRSLQSAVRQYDLISAAKIVHSYKDFLFLKRSFFFPHFML